MSFRSDRWWQTNSLHWWPDIHWGPSASCTSGARDSNWGLWRPELNGDPHALWGVESSGRKTPMGSFHLPYDNLCHEGWQFFLQHTGLLEVAYWGEGRDVRYGGSAANLRAVALGHEGDHSRVCPQTQPSHPALWRPAGGWLSLGD